MFVVPNIEFRALQTGKGKESGRTWYRMRFETETGDAYSVFLEEEVAPQFFGLQRGSMIALVCDLAFSKGNVGLRILGWQAPEE